MLTNILKDACCSGSPTLKRAESIAEKTNTSIADVNAMYINFLDEHPDGAITKTELSSMMKKFFPGEYIDDLDDHIFRVFDITQNGKIEFRDLMIFVSIMANGTRDEKLDQIFRVFDIKNDGVISKTEFIKVATILFSWVDKRWGTTQDQEEDKETAQSMAERAFKEVDKNGDSTITKGEFIDSFQLSKSSEKLTTMLKLTLRDYIAHYFKLSQSKLKGDEVQ